MFKRLLQHLAKNLWVSLEWLKVIVVMRKGQILDYILMVKPTGFADHLGRMRERGKMRPQFLAWALRRVVLPFTFHIYDSWIISSYHLYLSGLDKYHQLNKQALSGNKQDPLHCDHLCQALAFLEKQIRQIFVSLSYSMDYICHYLIICVKVLLNHIQKCLGKNQHVQVKRKF